jgi:hypothetical protein
MVILVGLSPLGIVDRSSAAQEGSSLEETLDACTLGGSNDGADDSGEWWSAVCRPIPILGARTPASPMQGYLVKFAEAYGATRPLTDVNEEEEDFEVEAEFMAVVVMEGFFALDLTHEPRQSIVVTPADGLLDGLTPLHSLEPPFYEPINTDTACDPDCTVGPGEAVLLEEGDVAVAQPGTLCLWCLLGRDEVQDPNVHGPNVDDHNSENLEPGLLGVFALLAAPGNPESFSWIRDWDRVQGDDPAARTDEPTFLSWAFNPHGSKCGGG